MSDTLLRIEPVSVPFASEGVTISWAPPMARYALRAREPRVLEGLLGLALPRMIGLIEGQIVCLGPDEWMLRAAAGTRIAAGEGLPVAVTDISERAVCLTVQGPRAAQTLMAGCPLDLDRLAVGRATRTLFETVEIIVLHTHPDVFEVEVWRSFAPWLGLALERAARDLG